MTTQFSLAALLQYITFCAILAAFSGVTGVVATMLLMLFALALMTRHGLLALGTLAASVIACGGDEAASYANCAVVVLLAGLLCIWYSMLRTRRGESGQAPGS